MFKARRYDKSLIARLRRLVQLTGVASEANVLPPSEKEHSRPKAADRREGIEVTELPWC